MKSEKTIRVPTEFFTCLPRFSGSDSSGSGSICKIRFLVQLPVGVVGAKDTDLAGIRAFQKRAAIFQVVWRFMETYAHFFR
jgi:hypothetical protein